MEKSQQQDIFHRVCLFSCARVNNNANLRENSTTKDANNTFFHLVLNKVMFCYRFVQCFLFVVCCFREDSRYSLILFCFLSLKAPPNFGRKSGVVLLFSLCGKPLYSRRMQCVLHKIKCGARGARLL